MKKLYTHNIRNQSHTVEEIERNIKILNNKSSYFKIAVTETESRIIRINEYPFIGNNALSFIATIEKNDLENSIIKLTTGIRTGVFYVYLSLFLFNIFFLFQSLGIFPFLASSALAFFAIYRYNSFLNKLKKLLGINVDNSEFDLN